ncbi:queF [Acrasis kona]|uniref:QueF n=1 Tax=Acrasis kona TaxID=1008807 RepID=A0AAW2YUB4_9EUKA
MEVDQFQKQIKKLIKNGFVKEYEKLTKNEKFSAKLFIRATVQLIPIFKSIKNYNSSIPSFIDYTNQALKILYTSFVNEFNKMGGRDACSGKELLKLADCIFDLNQFIDSTFPNLNHDEFEFLEYDYLMKNAFKKFISESRDLNSKMIRDSIEDENWIAINQNDSKLHSRSSCSLFSQPNFMLKFIHELNHIQKEKSIEAMGQFMIESSHRYVSELHESCINYFLNHPSSCPNNDHHSSSSSPTFEISISDDIYVKLNNMFVVKEHLVVWIQSQFEIRNMIELPWTLYQDLESNLYQDLKSLNPVQLSKKNKTTQIKLDQDDSDLQELNVEKSTFVELNASRESVMDIMIDLHRSKIKSGIQNTLLDMKKEFKKKKDRNVDLEEFESKFKNAIVNLFVSNVMDPFVIPFVCDFSRICYDAIQFEFMLLTFDMLIDQLCGFIISMDFENDDLMKPIKPYQLNILKMIHKHVLIPYFGDSKPKSNLAISMEKLESHSTLLKSLFVLFELNTLELINVYAEFKKLNHLNRISRIKHVHIIALLRSRKKDGVAKKFWSEHWKQNEERRVVVQFGLKHSDSEQDVLICSFKIKDSKMSLQVCHLTKSALCIESRNQGVMKGGVGSKRVDIKKVDLKSNKSITTAESSRVFLSDITAVKVGSHLVLGSSLKVYFNGGGVCRMYFAKSKNAEAMYQELVKQGKKIGNSKVENQDKNKK